MRVSEVSTSVVKWSDCLSNRVSNIIRKFRDQMKFAACMVFFVYHIPLFFISIFYLCIYGSMFCMLLFNFVNYVFLLLCLRILIVIYVLFYIFCFIVLSYVLFFVNIYCTIATAFQLNCS
jgi:hypothetical protein